MRPIIPAGQESTHNRSRINCVLLFDMTRTPVEHESNTPTTSYRTHSHTYTRFRGATNKWRSSVYARKSAASGERLVHRKRWKIAHGGLIKQTLVINLQTLLRRRLAGARTRGKLWTTRWMHAARRLRLFRTAKHIATREVYRKRW